MARGTQVSIQDPNKHQVFVYTKHSELWVQTWIVINYTTAYRSIFEK